jgi:predicted HD superfamily hydrolase involved in NAD metabolism
MTGLEDLPGGLVPAEAIGLLHALPRDLAAHCARTAALARELARRHGADPDLAARTAWLHDVARHWRDGSLLRQAEAVGIPVDEPSRRKPVLLHGPVGAELLRQRGALEPGPAYDAIWWHTSCRPGACELELLLFVADKLEPKKLNRAPELQPAMEAAQDDIAEAARLILNWRLDDLQQTGQAIQPVMVQARDWLAAGRPQLEPAAPPS